MDGIHRKVLEYGLMDQARCAASLGRRVFILGGRAFVTVAETFHFLMFFQTPTVNVPVRIIVKAIVRGS